MYLQDTTAVKFSMVNNLKSSKKAEKSKYYVMVYHITYNYT